MDTNGLKEAGLPIGGPDFNPYVMLEVHYNNPSIRGGMSQYDATTSSSRYSLLNLITVDVCIDLFGVDWVDSSGIRLWYTHHLRKYDAGVMELGLEYTDKMAIPPQHDSFTLTGFCLPQCTVMVQHLKRYLIIFLYGQMRMKCYTCRHDTSFDVKLCDFDDHLPATGVF